jgi:hypothetical protein
MRVPVLHQHALLLCPSPETAYERVMLSIARERGHVAVAVLLERGNR